MLEPTSRLTLIESLRPPAGYDLDAAMVVTFTLDLRALLAVPAAFALGRSGALSGGGGQEPIELLHAVRAHARKLTVLAHTGEIALPPSRRVFAFLEQTVVPVRAPRHGVVHPKVWVLRFRLVEPESADASTRTRLRVLVASRNLTFDSSWDTVVRLDESDNGSGCSLSPLGDMFERLHATAPENLAAGHRDRVTDLAAALRETQFALPAEVDGLDVHVLGLDSVVNPLPAQPKRSLVISPFMTDDFFKHPLGPNCRLVSRAEALDALSPQTLKNVEAYIFDDGSVHELDSLDDRRAPFDPGRPLTGLHAKVFCCETDQGAHLFLGSANATGAAFGANVEVLLELRGSVAALGIDRMCEPTLDEPGLADLFVRYVRDSEIPVEPGESSSLDALRRAVANAEISGTAESSPGGWAVTYRSETTITIPDGVVLECWPLSTQGNRRRVRPGEPLDLRFETTLDSISGFLAFSATDEAKAVTEFVLPVALTGVPEDRDRTLLKSLIGNAERFFQYLLALLDEGNSEPDFAELVDRAASDDPNGDLVPMVNLPVLERLLRTARRDPARLLALDPLVRDLAADDTLPPEFPELWSTLISVAGPTEQS